MARSYYYYQVLRKSIVQFLDVFKNVKIERKNSAGNTTGYIKVPLKYGTKEKVWYWLNEHKDEEFLPAISVILSSVEYDAQRQGSKIHSIVKSTNYDTNTLSRFINPVPYNLGFTMTLWSLHMVDIDQILEQILPYFSPAIFVRVYIPELDATFELKVLFNGCSPDITYEIADEDARVIKWNLDFMVHTYLLKPLESKDIINKVIQKVYTNESAWDHRFTETEFTSGADGSYEAESVYTQSETIYYNVPEWEANTYYDIGDSVIPTTKNGYTYIVNSYDMPGKSGSTEPTWSLTNNVPIADGDLIWTRYEQDYTKRLVNFSVFN